MIILVQVLGVRTPEILAQKPLQNSGRFRTTLDYRIYPERRLSTNVSPALDERIFCLR